VGRQVHPTVRMDRCNWETFEQQNASNCNKQISFTCIDVIRIIANFPRSKRTSLDVWTSPRFHLLHHDSSDVVMRSYLSMAYLQVIS
jgi:hypothetical protein